MPRNKHTSLTDTPEPQLVSDEQALQQSWRRRPYTILDGLSSYIEEVVPGKTRKAKLARFRRRYVRLLLGGEALAFITVVTCISSIPAIFTKGTLQALQIAAIAFSAQVVLSFLVLVLFAITDDISSKTWMRWLATRMQKKAVKKAAKHWRRQLTAWDKANGWRPREGAKHPKGRSDTYDRFRLHARVSLDGKTLYLRINHWKYVDKVWTLADYWRFDYEGKSHSMLSFANNETGHILYTKAAPILAELAHNHEEQLRLAAIEKRAHEEHQKHEQLMLREEALRQQQEELDMRLVQANALVNAVNVPAAL